MGIELEPSTILVNLLCSAVIIALSLMHKNRSLKKLSKFKLSNKQLPIHLRGIAEIPEHELNADIAGNGLAFFLIMCAMPIISSMDIPPAMKVILPLITALSLVIFVPRLIRKVWGTIIGVSTTKQNNKYAVCPKKSK